MSFPLFSSFHSHLEPRLTALDARIPLALRPFLTLSYPVPDCAPANASSSASASASAVSSLPRGSFPAPEVLYGQGPLDACLVFSCAVAFTVLRAVVMRGIAEPFAQVWLSPSAEVRRTESKAAKRRRRGKVQRFSEQGWMIAYPTVFWTIGSIILSRIPRWYSPEQIWGTYPVLHLPALTKFYYLAQEGWWFHQIYVINTEKRRNDHYQMLTHHALSISLIITSYIAHFTRVGTIIHTLMDFCDILLPLAKMLRYLGCSNLCDVAFVLFLISWVVSRQMGLAWILYSMYTHAHKLIPFQWDPSRGLYLTRNTYLAFFFMQLGLYVLATMWFYLACMVAVRVVQGKGAEDSRSDDEGDEDGVNDMEDEMLDEVPSMHDAGSAAGEKAGSGVYMNGNGNGHGNGHANGHGYATNGHSQQHADGSHVKKRR